MDRTRLPSWCICFLSWFLILFLWLCLWWCFTHSFRTVSLLLLLLEDTLLIDYHSLCSTSTHLYFHWCDFVRTHSNSEIVYWTFKKFKYYSFWFISFYTSLTSVLRIYRHDFLNGCIKHTKSKCTLLSGNDITNNHSPNYPHSHAK